jgi:hypothetical protein
MLLRMAAFMASSLRASALHRPLRAAARRRSAGFQRITVH